MKGVMRMATQPNVPGQPEAPRTLQESPQAAPVAAAVMPLQVAGPPMVAPQPLRFDEERLRVAIYGRAGTGKTTLAATFPRPLFVDSDVGLISVAGIEALRHEPTSAADLTALGNWCAANQ